MRLQLLQISIGLLVGAEAQRGRNVVRPTRDGRPRPENQGTERSYRCATSAYEASQYTGDGQCADQDLFCYDSYKNEPGNCDKINEKRGGARPMRCFSSPNCQFQNNPDFDPPRNTRVFEYRCIDSLDNMTKEQCEHAIPCGLGDVEDTSLGPDEAQCRLHDGGRHKCNLVTCDDAGLPDEPEPETLEQGIAQDYEYFFYRPWRCAANSDDTDCDTSVPCVKEVSDKKDQTQKDDSKCIGHHACEELKHCVDLHLAFGDHIKVTPGLFHEHQTKGGHKIIIIGESRCVSGDFTNEQCNSTKECTDDSSCGDGAKCQDTCPFIVMSKKVGPSNEEIPYDHPTMKGKFIKFTFGGDDHQIGGST